MAPLINGRRSRVGDRLRTARESCTPTGGSRPTQEWLGQQTGRTGQQVSSFERGREIPSLQALRELITVLGENSDPPASREVVDLSSWLSVWLADRVERDLGLSDENVQTALRMIEPITSPRAAGSGPIRSLAEFPGSGPLTVIVGDRRELKANSVADCFIYSVATTDFMYLNHLGESFSDVAIRTDKLLVRMGRDYLRSMPELAQRNLLIIGSLAVNWGARLLNREHTLFPARIDSHAMEAVEKLTGDRRLRDPRFAAAFWDLAQAKRKGEAPTISQRSDPTGQQGRQESEVVAGADDLVHDVLGDSTAKSMMKKFAGLGFIDIADRQNHGTVTYATNDFATVSLAPNPWDQTGRYRAVVCAGIHGPGTAAALRELLTNPGEFADRPLGAIVEVNVNPDLDWATRFDKATVTFQTERYTVDTVEANLRNALSGKKSDNPISVLLSETEIRSRLDFVHEIQAESEPHPGR